MSRTEVRLVLTLFFDAVFVIGCGWVAFQLINDFYDRWQLDAPLYIAAASAAVISIGLRGVSDLLDHWYGLKRVRYMKANPPVPPPPYLYSVKFADDD